MSVSAACILLISQGQILTIDSSKKNVIGLPGGKLLQHESSFEAALRELYEETGIKETDIEGKLTGVFCDMCHSKTDTFKRYVDTYIYVDDTFIDRLNLVSSAEGEAIWSNPEILVTENNPYRDYNSKLLKFTSYHFRKEYNDFL